MRKRRKYYEDRINHDRWLISYADFITLLFAFFVVMYALSTLNENKYRVMSNSVVHAFDKFSVFGSDAVSDSEFKSLPELHELATLPKKISSAATVAEITA